MKKYAGLLTVACLCAAGLFIASNFAQAQDRGDFRERMLDRISERLDVTEDEWSEIEPKLETVIEKQVALSRLQERMWRRGNRQGPEAPAVVKELQAALDKEDASAEEIETKLNALREAREKSEDELENARDELREVLDLKNEAALVLVGFLK